MYESFHFESVNSAQFERSGLYWCYCSQSCWKKDLGVRVCPEDNLLLSWLNHRHPGWLGEVTPEEYHQWVNRIQEYQWGKTIDRQAFEVMYEKSKLSNMVNQLNASHPQGEDEQNTDGSSMSSPQGKRKRL